MGKAFSTKALSRGTLLREWRLDEVLGVGGFGIVYLGRGIYFDDLVAIKEYFPSSISDRDDEDTVVPIDSDAEEVHALGLKKFVEEAKLLWNLSTPERHPNIVNVRSLFEIHGTAYMVMDFEDGNSLSRLLKEGGRFNERTLLDIIKPIAEGLDRAHRVGALHRDIKPPNILINADGRPVLIDFGSARVEVSEATKTSINFHTPPYAAIEQYVKTFPQGPWTDIYALGVVLYECVAGEKPPEVLERLHGGLGQPLATGHWPGYNRRFLAAIDAAMIIRPEDRPQSIRSWLAMFEGDASSVEGSLVVQKIEEDASPAITVEKMCERTKLNDPHDTRDRELKRADKEPKTGDLAARADTARPDKSVNNDPVRKAASAGPQRRSTSKFLIGAGAAVIIGASVGGWAVFYGGSSKPVGAPISTLRSPAFKPAFIRLLAEVATLPSAANSLADDARAAGVPGVAVHRVTDAGKELDQRYNVLQLKTAQSSEFGVRSPSADAMKKLAVATFVEFANALLNNGEDEARRLAGSPDQTASVTKSLDRLRVAVKQTAVAADVSHTLAGARTSLEQWQGLKVAVANSYHQIAASKTARLPAIRSAKVREAAPIREVKTAKHADSSAAVAPSAAPPVSRDLPAKVREIQSVVREGRTMARRVMGRGTRESAQLARNYDRYLSSLKDSSRGIANDHQADLMLAQAKRTRAYLQYLMKQSDARA